MKATAQECNNAGVFSIHHLFAIARAALRLNVRLQDFD